MLTGDSGEKCPVRPIRNVLKNSFIFQSEWDRFQKIFATVYVNLELLVTEEFFTYGIMVKILATLKRPSAKTCYSMQKLEPVIERLYLSQCCSNKFFVS